MSYTLEIFKINTSFGDVQMILLPFFNISTGFRFTKNQCECSVHILRRPWIMIWGLSALLWYPAQPFFSDVYFILIPWVPMLIRYLECLPYYDIWIRYHNNADKCVYLIIIYGVSSLLWYTVLNDRPAVYAVTIGGVSM